MNTKNPIDSSETTQTQPLDALILLVVKAAEHCPQDLADRLVEACDALEEEHDTLKAQLDKREFQYRALCTDHRMEKLDAEEERDALNSKSVSFNTERWRRSETPLSTKMSDSIESLTVSATRWR